MPLKAETRSGHDFLAVLVLLGAMVVGGVVALDRHSGPRASSVTATASKPVLPQSHNACGDISRGQVTRAIGTPRPFLRVINSATAIDASWERAPEWSGCIWAGFDRETDTGGGVQLAVAPSRLRLRPPASTKKKQPARGEHGKVGGQWPASVPGRYSRCNHMATRPLR